MKLVEELDLIIEKLTSAKLDLMKFEVKESFNFGLAAMPQLFPQKRAAAAKFYIEIAASPISTKILLNIF